MTRSNAAPLLGAVLLLLGACDGSKGSGAGGGAGAERAPGFEYAEERAGLAFRMQFLATEQGEKFKVNLYDHGSGVSVVDVDGDGLDDLFFANQLGPNALYRNRGDGTFEDVTERAGPLALPDGVCVAASFADYDRDGDQDAYLTTIRARGGNRLLRNDGGCRFTDVTEAAGLTLVAHSQSSAFFDYDADGDADLFVTNTAGWTVETFHEEGAYFEGRAQLFDLIDSPLEYNRLYRNDGDGTFTDVTEAAGVKGVGWGGDTALLDYDADGRTDLLVTNMFGASQLWHNRGDGTFEETREHVLGKTSWGTIGAKAFDADGDGRLDLFLSDMHSDMWMAPDFSPKAVQEGVKFDTFFGPRPDQDPTYGLSPEKKRALYDRFRFDPEKVVFGNTLFVQRESGRFEEVSDRANMETFWPWGTAAGDFDGDGDVDMFIAAGMGFPYFYWRNSLRMNRGDGTFEERAEQEGIEPPAGGRELPIRLGGKPAPRSSRSAATLDFDGDGRLDVVVNNFNDRPYLLHNRFPQRHWLGLRLRGVKSNPDAIGAIVTVRAAGRPHVRIVESSSGYLSQSSRTLHVGLGDAAEVESVEIVWPGGARQTVRGLAADRVHEIVEEAR